jgi:hypothetical protein
MAQVDSGKYGNDSEYFRDLIRRDQDRREAETQLRFMYLVAFKIKSKKYPSACHESRSIYYRADVNEIFILRILGPGEDPLKHLNLLDMVSLVL